MEDLGFALFLAVVCWLAVKLNDGDGGGRRSRVPVAI